MNVQEQVQAFLESQPDPKRSELIELHRRIQALLPGGRLWFLDGRDETGKVVTNPNIGYGLQIIQYADGKTKEFYQVGISPNTTGISVYILGIEDKKYLIDTYGKSIGKASVTGYCIKFRSLRDIQLDVLEAAMRDGIKHTAV